MSFWSPDAPWGWLSTKNKLNAIQRCHSCAKYRIISLVQHFWFSQEGNWSLVQNSIIWSNYDENLTFISAKLTTVISGARSGGNRRESHSYLSPVWAWAQTVVSIPMSRCMVIATESVRHWNHSCRALRKWNSTQTYFWVILCSAAQYWCQGQDFIILMTRLNPIMYIFKVLHPLMDIWLIINLGYWAYYFKKHQCMGLGVCLM